MNTKYEKELNRICLHIHVPEIYEEDYQMPMLRANKIPGVRVELDGKLFDGTVKGRLAELSRRISDTVV